MSEQRKVVGSLEGQDGNGFMLVGYWRRLAKRQGFEPDYIDKVTTEAMSGDYDHLLTTLLDHMEAA